jgi:hypothetical protein
VKEGFLHRTPTQLYVTLGCPAFRGLMMCGQQTLVPSAWSGSSATTSTYSNRGGAAMPPKFPLHAISTEPALATVTRSVKEM